MSAEIREKIISSLSNWSDELVPASEVIIKTGYSEYQVLKVMREMAKEKAIRIADLSDSFPSPPKLIFIAKRDSQRPEIDVIKTITKFGGPETYGIIQTYFGMLKPNEVRNIRHLLIKLMYDHLMRKQKVLSIQQLIQKIDQRTHRLIAS